MIIIFSAGFETNQQLDPTHVSWIIYEAHVDTLSIKCSRGLQLNTANVYMHIQNQVQLLFVDLIVQQS